MPIIDTLIRAITAAINEAFKPQTHVDGDKFESHVRNMFPEEVWGIKRMTKHYGDAGGRHIEQNKDPDFLFEHKKSKRRVNIECKYRRGLIERKIEWCKYYQFKRYKELDKRHRNLYIIIGFGGSPTNPDRIFRIPLSELRYYAVYPNSILKYTVSNDHKFRLEWGKLV